MRNMRLVIGGFLGALAAMILLRALEGRACAGGLVVVAPHPDDEALIAGGAIHAALARGEAVEVVVLTNGDFACGNDGLAREEESVRGLAALGLAEKHVHFLGYPDGFLARLGDVPLSVRRLEGGVCTDGDTTYGAHGAGGAEAHRVATGKPAHYVARELVGDLRRLLASARPSTLIVTHPQDTHPDHAQAYAFVRQALSHLPTAPRLLRAFVHNDDCWPTGTQAGGDCPPGEIAPSRPTPLLSGRLAGYLADLRLPVPPDCLSPEATRNPKLQAIFAHRSQVRDDPKSYLISFARADEPFFTETLVRRATLGWVAPAEAGAGAPGAVPLRALWPLRAGGELALPQAPPAGTEPGSPTYAIVADVAEQALRLERRRAGAPAVALATWPLPRDRGGRRGRSWSLLVARDAAARTPLTFTLLQDGGVRGQAVDPLPPLAPVAPIAPIAPLAPLAPIAPPSASAR